MHSPHLVLPAHGAGHPALQAAGHIGYLAAVRQTAPGLCCGGEISCGGLHFWWAFRQHPKKQPQDRAKYEEGFCRRNTLALLQLLKAGGSLIRQVKSLLIHLVEFSSTGLQGERAICLRLEGCNQSKLQHVQAGKPFHCVDPIHSLT
jgi:hypothetical protein